MIDLLERITAQEKNLADRYENHVRVCISRSCLSSDSDELKTCLEQELEKHGLQEVCKVTGAGCMGLCSKGPMLSSEKKGEDRILYSGVRPEDAAAIIENLGQDPIKHLHLPSDIPFFEKQQRIVLENTGLIDPERIEEYIARDGYSGLLKALTEMSPSDVIEQIVRSGLRGRGGGGYPTGLKWTTVAKAGAGGQKYVICNADEGGPGAFMDRSVLEADPHRVLEGMAIAGYAVGASEGYIYVRGEYPLAVGRLEKGIQQAREKNILGSRIFGTPFSFNIHIRVGAGAYVCGEETALIASIEGRRGQPRPRPPYPAELGLWGKPTLINNVETLANVPPILRKGGDWYAAIGTEHSKGTKVFALAGTIHNNGLIEVPMGTTINQIVNEMGGGVNHGKCKAIQTGGPSGGCVPQEYFDTPVDYESLKELGSIMGSGGMIVMDETTRMIDLAKYFMEFCMLESCGKCIPCRVGTTHMYDLLDKISRGEGTFADLALLEELGNVVRDTSLCGLGQSAPNPVFSTLRYFRHEYLALIKPAEGINPERAIGIKEVTA